MDKTVSSVKEKVILGIDPGTNVMGYGVLYVTGAKLSTPSVGAIQIKEEDAALKLKTIFERTLALIEEFRPDEFAVEAPFFGKNVQSMLKLGRAQGVAMAAALTREVPITEYSPRKVKQALTGNGAASKEQVAAMVQKLVALDKLPKYLDATDGLAVAICHHFQSSRPVSVGSGKGGWGKFLRENPERVR